MDLPGVRRSCCAKRKIVLKLAQCALLWLLLIRVHFPQNFFFCTLREGGARARPWISRQGASFQHAYFSPKYPYLPDLVFNDSLFQVQHRLDYLGPMLVVISLGSCHSSFPHHSYKYWHALSWSRRERHQYPSAKSTNTYPTTFKTTAPTELSTTHLWVFGGIASCC